MEMFRKTGWSSVIISIILIIVGILLCTYPEEILKTISVILGVTIILVGVFKTLNALSNKGSIVAFENELAIGLTAIVVGLLFIIYSGVFTTIFRLIIGIWILYTSFLKFSYSIKLKAANIKSWLYVLVLSALIFICGFIILMVPGIVMSMIGWLVIIYAVVDLINTLLLMKNISQLF